MSEIKLVAEARTEFGKGAARRIRRADKIPAVLYGHGSDPLHVTLPGHDTMMALKHSNALFSIELEGKAQLAITKDVQRDPVRNVIEHVDLLIVKKGEKVAVDVPVVVTGESAPGTIHLVDLQTLAIEAEATHLPESIEVSIEGLEAGSQVLAGDVTLPQGATLTADPELIVVSVTEPQAEALPEDEGAAEEAAEAPAEAAAE
ncbi:50S ribosomal protein L25/general stress protein Ctc [Cellulosimicrobium composti]|uniref:Large ribosomal subunit protein bL25 n=1 Tax=Cellulosimicrobium composti TaxID=2672572 RepID=A0A6N7ZD29_9MICO|nr:MULTISPECIES: 50S ribosomal protein L25/general stress protein Ctc [Cellulosimicrobium]TWG85537.1 large subunit ribosomal protein L25 [Cellulosimicrobium cellulans J34]SMF26253.1 LSU ribosomal protein L25P [Cellulosimicrobium cellulans J1]KFD43205.1 50S ribosomal protein L25 [Cellulosimicrobium sp. MM]MTG87354.1 50S ribosomal protein L25/general stress protein Ctc [Cellulosimicrobium composti]NDO89122.1 50S ribosomal protein L25/general stress protein Ctc [Cellulosimicrobium composti]